MPIEADDQPHPGDPDDLLDVDAFAAVAGLGKAVAQGQMSMGLVRTTAHDGRVFVRRSDAWEFKLRHDEDNAILEDAYEALMDAEDGSDSRPQR